MKSFLPVPCLPLLVAIVTLLVTPQGMGAETAATKPREYKDLLQSVEKDLKKLRGGKEKEADELSTALTKAEGNKEVTLKFKITRIDPWKFPEDVKGWRVHSVEEKVRESGTSLNIVIFAYFKEDSSGKVTKLKKGDDIIVTGKLTKSNFTVDKSLRFHIDLSNSTLVSVK